MCGIAGMVGPDANEDVVARMTAAQSHRGPDGGGIWSKPGVSLGNRRLKILDLSEAGRQPMCTPDERYTIVYNGEVYNYRELRDELRNVEFRSQSDTEVVLHAYARWGPECLQRFVGMYAFAIWDAKQHELFCARDRLGIKPFYYAQLGESIVFASEIRALLTGGVKPAINQTAVFEFLARDFYDHSDETFFAGIRKLAPGHYFWVRNGKPTTSTCYWNFASEVSAVEVSTDVDGRAAQLLMLCKQAVSQHLLSDVPVGITVSAGLDSATLLTLLDQVHADPARVEAFSFCFAEAAYSERPYVEAVASRTGRQAHFVEVTPHSFSDGVEEICREQEEPFAGLPISAYSQCFRLARDHGFVVLMDGSGVDEGLAGYTRFLPAHWADLFVAGEHSILERELLSSNVRTPTARQRALAQMNIASQPYADIGQGQDLTTSVRPDCLNPEYVNAMAVPLPEFDRPFDDHLRNLMYRELRYTKLPRALRFRDRLSMAVGCELRPPFLDHQLLALEFALPREDRIENGVQKAALRRGTRDLLPDSLRFASKRSVQTPQREWFRTELREWVRERIDTPSFWQRGWVDRRVGLAALDAFLRGEGDNSFFLWQWINLEIWATLFIDNAPRKS